MSISENIAVIRGKIAAAAREVGRDPGEILLVGASKMNDADACRAAIAAGIDALGENRVQEMTAKLAEDAYTGAPLHFIGHLQRNKVRQVVGKVDLNIGMEEAKSGFAPDEVEQAARAALLCPHVRVLGLMTIPPADASEAENREYFRKVSALYVDINGKLFHNDFKYLSMGMSGDYEDAIRAGATMVRVGSAIFGQRHYS